MIDTIVLILNKDAFQITQPDKFTPSAKWIYNPSKDFRGIQSKQHSTKKELQKGFYKPRLNLSNRINHLGHYQISLKIELSLPKLFFGNNFNELKLKDFKQVVSKLTDVLKEMGVETTAETISKAQVYTVHYSKNIPLTDGSIPYSYINKFKESNVKLFLDVNQTDYRNDGHSYKWHCNSYEVVFYDKIKDLEKAKSNSKSSLEKDNSLQLNVFETINAIRKSEKFEILRMEVRLNKRRKIRELFKKLQVKSNLTFKSIFKPSISKKVLLHHLDLIESRRPMLVDYRAKNDKALLSDLIFNNPELGSKQLIFMFGLKRILENINIRELRVMLKNRNQRSWFRIISELNKVKLPGSNNSFEVIRDCLMKFKLLQIKT